MAQYDYDELVTVEHDRDFTGSLRAGITIAPGVHAVVTGVVAGPVNLGEKSILTVTGTFVGEIESSEGLLVAHGVVDVEPEDVPGRLAVSVDSLLITDRGNYRVGADGKLTEVREAKAGDFKIDTSKVVVWDRDLRRFAPLEPKKSGTA